MWEYWSFPAYFPLNLVVAPDSPVFYHHGASCRIYARTPGISLPVRKLIPRIGLQSELHLVVRGVPQSVHEVLLCIELQQQSRRDTTSRIITPGPVCAPKAAETQR